MGEQLLTVNKFFGGISQAEKVGLPGAFRFGQCLDITSDPNKLTIAPAGAKVSGSTVVDLVKWIVDASPYATDRYFYGDAGKLYKETSGGTWSVERTVSNSNGQGLAVHNNYLYYTQNTQIGRYGPLNGSPSFTDNWQTGLSDTSSTKYAPILPFKEGFAVGHGNKLGWWDGAVWTAAQLTLPPGFEIRTLTQVQEFIVMGAWQGNAVTDSEQGYAVFWDGTATTFNYAFPTDGAPNAFGNTRNRLNSIMGSIGQIYEDQEPFNLVHQIPFLPVGKYVEIMPGAITTYKGQTMIGMGVTDSDQVYQGIYEWGAKSMLYPEALNFKHKISTGTTKSTGMKVGAVLGVGDALYWSWKDGSDYGVDRVTSTSAPAASATYESLVHDDERPGDEKMPKVIKVTHEPLRADESIRISYKVDRATSWTDDTANTTLDSQETRLVLPASRYKHFEFKVTLGASATTKPTVNAIDYLFDNLKEERQL